MYINKKIMNTKIKVENLSKDYLSNEKVYNILKNVNIEIYEKELVSIIGSSGAGKSTLLYILGTLEFATEGKIFYTDRENNSFDILQLKQKELNQFRNKKIGFVFQFHHLLPEFNVWENIMMPLYLSNDKITSEKEKNILEMMDYAQISDLTKKMPSQISGGEQQRVAIIRALANNPEVIFADEPTGNLDSENSKLILTLLKSLQKDLGITTVIATHSEYIAKESDRIIKISDGMII